MNLNYEYLEGILNLTQHKASEEQVSVGVFEPSEKDKEKIKKLLTFEKLPDPNEMKERAKKIVKIAEKYKKIRVMIGGAPYFMPYLEKELIRNNFVPLHAFTKRVVKEENGKKISVFKHEGFIMGGMW